MRLLYLNHNFRDYGTYFRAMPMAEYMAKRGHQVTLLTVSPTLRTRASWSTINGVWVGEMPNFGQMNSGGGYGPLDNLYRIAHASAHRYDIVHMFDHKPNATFAGFPGRLRGAKLISDWADWWGGLGGLNDVPRRIPAIGKFEEWWEVESKRWADGVVTISTVLRERAIAAGCQPERVMYLPTGSPTERIHRVPISQAREKLGIPKERRMVAYIGGLKQSVLATVMEALTQLPDVWLTAIGPVNADEHSLAQSFSITDRFWQTGMIVGTEVTNYLGCANVLCIPMIDVAADRGRLPNKLLDYLAAGRPIVAGPVGDVRDIVAQNHAGLLASGTTEIKAAFERLFSDAALCDQLGQSARHTAETVFNWDRLIDQLEMFYSDILGHHQRQ
jgi:glycosyltransferase involved in cell wall biosynthesis